ncbi:hypothetical protein FRC06_004180 [Ceratobasidium sp. 370]|nr:hypothetical protein FRC06_004180 [Ceratobasidium sp. 370]
MEGFGGAEASSVTITVKPHGYQRKAGNYGRTSRWDWDLGPIELGWCDLLTIVVEYRTSYHSPCSPEFEFGVDDLFRSARLGVPASPRKLHTKTLVVFQLSLVLDSATIVSSAKGISQETPDASHPPPEAPETGSYRIWNVGFRRHLAASGYPRPVIQLATNVELDKDMVAPQDDITDEVIHWMLAPKEVRLFSRLTVQANSETSGLNAFVFCPQSDDVQPEFIKRNNTQTMHELRSSSLSKQTWLLGIMGAWIAKPPYTSTRSAPELPRTSPTPRVPPALTTSNPSVTHLVRSEDEISSSSRPTSRAGVDNLEDDAIYFISNKRYMNVGVMVSKDATGEDLRGRLRPKRSNERYKWQISLPSDPGDEMEYSIYNIGLDRFAKHSSGHVVAGKHSEDEDYDWWKIERARDPGKGNCFTIMHYETREYWGLESNGDSQSITLESKVSGDANYWVFKLVQE